MRELLIFHIPIWIMVIAVLWILYIAWRLTP